MENIILCFYTVFKHIFCHVPFGGGAISTTYSLRNKRSCPMKSKCCCTTYAVAGSGWRSKWHHTLQQKWSTNTNFFSMRGVWAENSLVDLARLVKSWLVAKIIWLGMQKFHGFFQKPRHKSNNLAKWIWLVKPIKLWGQHLIPKSDGVSRNPVTNPRYGRGGNHDFGMDFFFKFDCPSVFLGNHHGVSRNPVTFPNSFSGWTCDWF